MKKTGMVRNVDTLGRVVIPKEIRRTMKINTGDPMEFFVDGDNLIIHKYDTNGNMVQLLENVERSIQLSDTLIPGWKMARLLQKVKEMKAIMREADKK